MPNTLVSKVRAAFAQDGPIARAYPSYRPRDQQIQLAERLASLLESGNDVLLAHAPTGIGKTMAYLVPVLLGAKRVIISTGTIPLQDQIAQHELPRLQEILDQPRPWTVLKGRTHYLCLQRLARLRERPELEGLGQPRLETLVRWAESDSEGDLDHAPWPVEGGIFPTALVTTAEACTATACPFYDRCFVYRARRRAAEQAEIVIVNHHLLLSDMLLKREGHGSLLPDADCMVVDEAHRLPDLLFTALATSHGLARLDEFERDLRRWIGDGGGQRAERGDPLLRRLVFLLEALRREDNRKEEYVAPLRSLSTLFGEIAQIIDREGAVAQGDADALSLMKRAMEGAEFMSAWSQAVSAVPEGPRGERELPVQEGGVGERPPVPVHGSIAWLEGEGSRRLFRLLTDDPRRIFETLVASRGAAWAFLSATLAVGQSLEPFAHEIGVRPQEQLILESPFDHSRQALLYVPWLPDVTSPQYLELYAEHLAELLQETDGGALLLFTSHRALRDVSDRLAGRLGPRRRLLVHGEDSRGRLLARFRDDGRAVLAATQSFWEGVDVPGAALRLVAIDRLPFSPPDEPLSLVKEEIARRAGLDPFTTYALPQAVVRLCQGVGRLIRHEDDRGLVVIGDTRLLSRSYASVFRTSLPPFPLTRDFHEVVHYLRDLHADSGT